ncbi:MAG: Methyltransferase type 11 [Marmoricola sp.]|nr:Methyltransferase type 11 [Marmoricola sp.]
MEFFEAYEQVLTPLATASSLLQLVARADEAGLMAALQTPATLVDVAARTGLAEDTVATLCRALVTLKVAECHGDTVTLTAPWQALADPGAHVPLKVALAGIEIDGRLQRARTGDTFWSMPPADRVTYARSISPDPFSDELVETFRSELVNDPDRAAMAQGGRLLELGCGVAGRVLTTLRAMPQLTAVGIELSPDLADEARRRSVALGVQDRFDVICADAGEYASPQLFDYAFWSQFFFPEPSRRAALVTLRRVLRSGAVVHAPVGANFPAIDADPEGPLAREFALWRTVLNSWDVPERRPEQLVAEFEAAGFEDVGVIERPASPLLRARQP